MNISALKYFRRVVDSKSISKVSQNSFISQSALSQMIQRLESEIGYQLLKRSNKGVSLTDMGAVVYKYSKIICRLEEEMEEELCRVAQNITNIRINGYYSFVNYSLPCVLYRVKKEFPKLNFESFGKSSEDSLKDLLNELTHISFINIEPNNKNIKYDTIGKEKIVLLANKDFDIPEKISIKELINYEMVFLNSFCIRKDYIVDRLKEVDLKFSDLNIMFEVNNISSAKSSLSNGLGVCFLPYMSVKKEIYEGDFKVIEITDFDLDYEIYVAKLNSCSTCDPLDPIEKVYQYFVDNGTDGIC